MNGLRRSQQLHIRTQGKVGARIERWKLHGASSLKHLGIDKAEY
jgi:hypothetical protein